MLLSKTSRNKEAALHPHNPYQFQNPRQRNYLPWILLSAALVAVVALVVALAVVQHDSSVSRLPSGQGAESQGAQDSGQTMPKLADMYLGEGMNDAVQEKLGDGGSRLTVEFHKKGPKLTGQILVEGVNVGGSGQFSGTLQGNKIELTVEYLDLGKARSYQLSGVIAGDGTMKGDLLTASGLKFGTWKLRPAG